MESIGVSNGISVNFFSYSTGFLGPLQVNENHYGKGYAAHVTKYIAKKMAEMGHDAYASIVEKNAPSRSLFSKLGFKSIGQVQLKQKIRCQLQLDRQSMQC